MCDVDRESKPGLYMCDVDRESKTGLLMCDVDRESERASICVMWIKDGPLYV